MPIIEGHKVRYPAAVYLPDTIEELVVFAQNDAIERSSGAPDAISRISNSLSRRFKPYVGENWTIADQIKDPEYQEEVSNLQEFLLARVGYILCPDGRLASLAFGMPGAVNIHRRLQGLPQTRLSTKDRVPVLDDPDLAASITTTITRGKRHGLNTEITEFLGPHIHSLEPVHGCGAFKNKAIASGHVPELGMRYGGVKEYFEELNDAFNAFNNIAERAGGKGTTFDLIHDAHSEGTIVGLRTEYKNFTSESLRRNILMLAAQGKILMTERIDDLFSQSIMDKANAVRGKSGWIDTKDPDSFKDNVLLIAGISKDICSEEQKKEFPWIPSSLRRDNSEAAVKDLALHAIWNTVYRILGNRRTGLHDLQQHPETVVSIGPTSALYNRQNIPLVQKVHAGPMKDEDIKSGTTLYNLAGDFMTSQGINLTEEGRVVLVTGEYDRALYANEDAAEAELNRIASTVRNNASAIREVLLQSVATGEAVILGCLHEPVTRKLIAVV